MVPRSMEFKGGKVQRVPAFTRCGKDADIHIVEIGVQLVDLLGFPQRRIFRRLRGNTLSLRKIALPVKDRKQRRRNYHGQPQRQQAVISFLGRRPMDMGRFPVKNRWRWPLFGSRRLGFRPPRSVRSGHGYFPPGQSGGIAHGQKNEAENQQKPGIADNHLQRRIHTTAVYMNVGILYRLSLFPLGAAQVQGFLASSGRLNGNASGVGGIGEPNVDFFCEKPHGQMVLHPVFFGPDHEIVVLSPI